MYVRWKKRMQTHYHRPTGVYILSAALVKSERVNGKPRQRIITYLGTIRENATSYHFHRLDFWTSALAHLDALNLDTDTRCRIETDLEKVVSKPTAQSKAQTAAELQALTESIKRL